MGKPAEEKGPDEKPSDYAHWRRVLKQALRDNNPGPAIEALKYMIAVSRDTPSHWSRLIGLLNQTGAETEAIDYLVRWRAFRPDQLAQQLAHAKRALAAGTAAQLKALWPAYAAELPQESRIAACLNLLRRDGAAAVSELLGAADRATLPPLLQGAADLCGDAPPDVSTVTAASPAELEIVTALTARFIGSGDRTRSLTGLRLLATGMDERAPVPGLNELVQAVTGGGDAELIAAMLPLARKNHHPLLRETFAAAVAEGRMALAAPVLDRLHELFRGNSSIFQLSLSVPDAAQREGIFDRLLERQRAWAEEDAASAAINGRNLMLCGRLMESRVALTTALVKWPGDARLHGELAETCFWLDDYESAETHARRALAEASSRPSAAGLLTRVAIAHGARQQCIEAFRQAEAAGPMTYPALPLHAAMCGGLLSEAFDYYWSERWRTPLESVFPGKLLDARPIEQALRDKSKITGSTVIVGIHGLGDAIKFAGAMPEIARLCESAVFLCEDRLLPLFQRSFGNLRFIARDSSSPVVDLPAGLGVHFDAATIELARQATSIADIKQFLRYLRAEPSKFPTSGASLRADHRLTASWLEALKKQPGTKIGLFWRSSLVGYTATHKRSELADWISLLRDAQVLIVPLQYGIETRERELLAAHPELFLVPEIDAKNDLDQLAALMSALDLVVALPGTTQHLAGALGVPTVMPAHPYDAAWRRNPETRCDWWSPSVRIVTGQLSDGLRGSIAETAHIVADWPILTGRGAGAT